MHKIISLFSALLLTIPSFSTIYYVAPSGNDANPGSIDQPLLTIQKAQTKVKAGDTVYIRGGHYRMTTDQVAQYQRIWACVTHLDHSGRPDHRINYWAYPGEHPVFDYSAIAPPGYRINAFQVDGSWIHIKGLEIIGVQVTIRTHTQSECFENLGSHNIYEQCSMHDGMAIGFYLKEGGDNLVLNCDAYNNWDNVSENGRGGNTDGFGCHPNEETKSYANNIFRGCRAWFNSDDGYDCINAFEAVTFDHCWAFCNGYNASFQNLGDGNGFKAGGYGISPDASTPSTIPRNSIRFCLAVHNKANGFYANHHPGGDDWFNNSAYNNGINFNMLNRSPDHLSDIAGYSHNLRNNLGLGARSQEVSHLDTLHSIALDNYFNLHITISPSDFLSLDESQLSAPRQPDGSLPDISFMHLASGSPLTSLNLGCFTTH